MGEIIRVKNISYGRYEELLIRRDALQKEAFQMERAYVREFGELLLEVFRLKVECIRKKKTIEYCQMATNRGKSVDVEKLQEYLRREMEEFQKQLNSMIEDYEEAKMARRITEAERLKIKKIYRRIVKRIHPDINPLVERTEALRELWQRVVIAYNCNDLKGLEETEILIDNVLKQLGDGSEVTEIPDIDKRIEELTKEIETILTTDPYQYKSVLENPEAVRDKKDALEEEKKSYTEYDARLAEILDGLLGNGVNVTWQMN